MKLGRLLAVTAAPLVSNLGSRSDSTTGKKLQRSKSQIGGATTSHVTIYLEKCLIATFNLADKGIIIDLASC